jgi:DNA polymerase
MSILTFPCKAIYWDLETRSTADLKARTGYNYAQDPNTEIMCSCWVDGDKIYVWHPYSDPEIYPAETIQKSLVGILEATKIYTGQKIEIYTGEDQLSSLLPLLDDSPWVAHNGFAFDCPVWMAQRDHIPVSGFADSLGLFRRVGLPAALDTASKYLFDIGKSEGHKTMQALCKPATRGIHKGQFMPVTVGNLSMLISYCISDILMLQKIMEEEVNPYVDTEYWEEEVYWLDCEINSLGFKIDCELSNRMIGLEQQIRTMRGYKVEELVGKDILESVSGRSFLRSVKQIRSWLFSEFDIDLPNLQRGTVEEYLETHKDTPEPVKYVLNARMGESTITTAKVKRGLSASSPVDSRVRGSIAYHSAHTGRFGGRVNQPHNMPRGHRDLVWDECLEKVTEACDMGDIAESIGVLESYAEAVDSDDDITITNILTALIRSTIQAPDGHELAIIDLASVEARGICYLAEDEAGLKVYREGLDDYKVLASTLFGCSYEEVTKFQRFIGKTGVLGCGYGMGVGGCEKFMEGYGLDIEDLSSMGITPRLVVNTYRDLHPKIAGHKLENSSGFSYRKGGIWKDLDDLIKKIPGAVDGEMFYCGRCFFWRSGDHMIVGLPSGRKLIYRDIKVAQKVPSWGGKPVDTFTFMGYKNGKMLRVDTYGGKISENLTQAFCRDLLMHGILRVRKELGLTPILHVHDEGVWEISLDKSQEQFEAMLRLMSSPPHWAQDFPMGCAGFLTPRYCKEPPRGARETKAYMEVISG